MDDAGSAVRADGLPPGFVDAVVAAPGLFAGAARATESRDLAIAGVRIRLTFAGSALADALGRSFAHLVVPPSPHPDLEIRLWDAASSGTPPPPLPGEVPDEQGPSYLVRTPAGLAVAHTASGCVSLLDPSGRIAHHWVTDVARVPHWERAAPLRFLLHAWLSDRGLLLVHAAAVGRPDAGVLMAGVGGSGKSTAALSCLRAGMAYAGDDYVAVGRTPGPTAFPIFGTAKLKPDDTRMLPSLLAQVDNADRLPDEKAVIFVNEWLPERIPDRLPIRAVVLPRVTGDALRLRPVSAGAALVGLAPSTIMQLGGARQAMLTSMAGVVEGLPAFVLETGPDPAAIPEAIRGLLEGLP